MEWIFKLQIRQNVEVYVDDMVVKSQTIAQHMEHLEQVFRELYKYNMRLNLEKCTSGIGGGKFLGFMITHQGIEGNHEKCTTILEMHSPTNIQEVQKLNGGLASLFGFLTKKTQLFYKLLKKTKQFLWDKTYEQAFLAFKKIIATPPVLS